MTRLEALTSIVQSSNTDLLVKVLIDLDIDPIVTYTASDADDMELAMGWVLYHISLMPDITEGGLSIKYDRKAMYAQVSRIFTKYGVTATIGSTINGTSRW